MTPLVRSSSAQLLLLRDGKEELVDMPSFFADHGIEGLMRLEANDFAQLPEGLFTHFNLEYTNFEAGKRYGLIRLLRHGYFKESGEERQPLLDEEGMRIGNCTIARQRIPYADLRDEDFAHSLPSIKSVAQLQAAILSRYSASMPELSPEEILVRGVSSTTVSLEPLPSERRI